MWSGYVPVKVDWVARVVFTSCVERKSALDKRLMYGNGSDAVGTVVKRSGTRIMSSQHFFHCQMTFAEMQPKSLIQALVGQGPLLPLSGSRALKGPISQNGSWPFSRARIAKATGANRLPRPHHQSKPMSVD